MSDLRIHSLFTVSPCMPFIINLNQHLKNNDFVILVKKKQLLLLFTYYEDTFYHIFVDRYGQITVPPSPSVHVPSKNNTNIKIIL